MERGVDPKICYWVTAEMKLIDSIETPLAKVDHLAISSDGSLVAATGGHEIAIYAAHSN